MGHLAKTRSIIHRAKLKNTSILRTPVLKLATVRKTNVFLKLDNNDLFKENTKISNLKLHKFTSKSAKKFGESGVTSDFKSLVNKDSTVTTNQYCSSSFRVHRDSLRREGESVQSTQQSCSQQARNVREDITINELASYFENLVHIPKKMSSMAEQMYT